MSDVEKQKATGESRRGLLASGTAGPHLDSMARLLGAEHYQQARRAAGERRPTAEERTATQDMTRHITVGIDGSDSARAAAVWAAEVAVRHGAGLRLLYATDVEPGMFGTGPNLARGLRDRGRTRLDEAEATVRQHYPDLAMDGEVRAGSPLAELIEASRTAVMMVVGSRGLGGVAGLLAGSTAVGLAGHGECPVAVIRDLTPVDVLTLSGPVVVGVDGSRASAAALAAAFEEASLAGAELVAVHAWSEAPLAGHGFAATRASSLDMLARNAERLLADQLEPYRQRYPDVPIRPVALADRPTPALIEQAVSARLLVVGSRGRGGFAGAVLGSVSQNLIQRAPCPLLVVRGSLVD